MKKLLAMVFAIIAIQMSLSAQDDQKALFESKIKSYTRMETTGIILTISGVLSGAIGFGVASSSSNDPNEIVSSEDFSGALLITAGVALVGCGVTFWAIGGANKTKYTRKLNALTLNLNPGMHQKISLVYRF